MRNPAEAYEATSEETSIICAYRGDKASKVLRKMSRKLDELGVNPSLVMARVAFDNESGTLVGELFFTRS